MNVEAALTYCNYSAMEQTWLIASSRVWWLPCCSSFPHQTSFSPSPSNKFSFNRPPPPPFWSVGVLICELLWCFNLIKATLWDPLIKALTPLPHHNLREHVKVPFGQFFRQFIELVIRCMLILHNKYIMQRELSYCKSKILYLGRFILLLVPEPMVNDLLCILLHSSLGTPCKYTSAKTNVCPNTWWL